jgi:hypothetical protein
MSRRGVPSFNFSLVWTVRRRATSVEENPAETRRLLLGPVGTGVRAANQATSVVRAACTAIPTAVHRTPIRRGGTHADRTVVAVVAVVVRPMMMCVCKCERA